MRTHTLAKRTLGIAPPPLKQGTLGKRMQGGHPPVPYRQHSGNWSRANKFARVPSNLAPWKD
jgi:hypothetical protein